MPTSEEIAQQLALLKIEFASSLASRISQLIKDLTELHQQEDPAACLQDSFRQIHSLSGSAGTFGYHHLSDQARQLELILLEFVNQGSLPDTRTADYLDYGLHKLLKLISAGPDTVQADDISQAPALSAVTTQRLVYIVEDDALLGEQLCLQLEHFGFKTRLCCSSTEAMLALKHEKPDALLLDIVLTEGQLAGIDLASRIQPLLDTHIPPIFMSSRKDWDARLAAVRTGGIAYFEKPVDVSKLVDLLNRLTQRVQAEPCRVLVVDDAAELAQHYALILRQAGMLAEVLTEPASILDKMEIFRPELVLLDFYFPATSGLEIAQVLRQHETHFSTPIVFLSTELERDVQLITLQQGDDFLEKPIQDNHLVSAVNSRVKRARDLNRLMYYDGLTGLLNQITLKRRLETELARSQRQGTTLSYIMLDIDHFKQVNDQHGHSAGDQVLKSLALLLRDRLRSSDLIGRSGGEEFGIIMPDTPAETAHQIIEDLRVRFAKLSWQNNNQAFKCSFSAGIACNTAFNQENPLIEAADHALYQAKANGRNQSVIHTECQS